MAKKKLRFKKLKIKKPQSTDQIAQELIECVAAQIKEAYVLARQQYLGTHRTIAQRWRPGPRWDYAWRSAAVYMLRNGLDAEVCVQAKMSTSVGRRSLVPPNQLYSDRDLESYKEACRENVGVIENTFNTQKALVTNYLVSFASELGMSRKDTLAYTLLNEALEVTPLFRYCLAASEGLTVVTKKYERVAIRQYLAGRKTYDRVWGDWIPDRLKEKAESVFVAVRYVTRRTARDDEE